MRGSEIPLHFVPFTIGKECQGVQLKKTFQVSNVSNESTNLGLFIGLDCVINFCCESSIVRRGRASPNSHTAKMADETTEEVRET